MKKSITLLYLTLLFLPLWALGFALIGDHQPHGEDPSQPEVFSLMLKDVNADSSMDMIICPGDVIFGRKKTPEQLATRQYDLYAEALEKYNHLPIHVAPGNHDIFDNEVARARFLDIHGRDETWYSFTRDGLNFVIIDTEEIDYHHCMSRRQMKWLKKTLKNLSKKPVIVMGHEPLFPVSDHVGSSLDACPVTQKKLFRLFRHYNVDYYICGHEHLYAQSSHGSMTQIISGGGGARVRAPVRFGGYFHLVKFTWEDDELKWEIIPYPGAEQYPLRHFRLEERGELSFFIEYSFTEAQLPGTLVAEYYFDEEKKNISTTDMNSSGRSFFTEIPVDPESKKLYLRFILPDGSVISHSDGTPFRVYLR